MIIKNKRMPQSWRQEASKIQAGVWQYGLSADGKAVTYRDWIAGLRSSESLRQDFIGILRDNPFKAFFWEVSPITENGLDAPFAFVLVESSSLQRITADPKPFRQHFEAAGEQTALSFPNLGGDAQLVVPTPQGPEEQYAHLAAFLRNASGEQLSAFWRQVAEAYEKRIGAAPRWLSAAGLGVYWLHVRVDSRPKYYRFEPYRTPPKGQ